MIPQAALSPMVLSRVPDGCRRCIWPTRFWLRREEGEELSEAGGDRTVQTVMGVKEDFEFNAEC